LEDQILNPELVANLAVQAILIRQIHPATDMT
jgi:hypothetical protein